MKNLLRTLFLQRAAVLPAFLLAVASFTPLTAGEITLEFLPPPMEGTISMGVYDKAGKLVRVLHREADLDEFKIALNGLVARWDGKNDAGEEVPGGRYRVKGYRVGELKVEGIEFHGNDWAADEDGPRLAAISRIAALPDGSLLLEGRVGNKVGPILLPDGTLLPEGGIPGVDNTQRFTFAPAAVAETPSEAAPEQSWVLAAAPGTAFPPETPADWSWSLAESPAEGDAAPARALRLRSADGTRELQIPLRAGSNTPTVTLGGGHLFILEEDAEGQELRGFDLAAPSPEATPEAAPGSQPPLLFTRSILRSDTFEQVRSRLNFPDGSPFEAQPTVRVTLVKNPLITKKRPTLALQLKIDAEGAFLATDDGLPLARVSETPNLRWAVMGRSAKENSLVIFESDGAAIEEYRVARPSCMMAFDAGLFTVKGPAKKSPPPEAPAIPEPTPEATPEAAPEPTPEETAPEVTPEAASVTVQEAAPSTAPAASNE